MTPVKLQRMVLINALCMASLQVGSAPCWAAHDNERAGLTHNTRTHSAQRRRSKKASPPRPAIRLSPEPITVETLRLEELHGKARVRIAGKGVDKHVDPKHLCKIQAGDEVICDSGELFLIVYGLSVRRRPGEGWLKIPEPDPALKAELDSFFQLTGRTRADQFAIISPPCADGAVRADSVKFQWVPFQNYNAATLSLSLDQKELWAESITNQKDGWYASEAAHNALRKSRGIDPGRVLTFRLKSGPHQLTATFTVLSAEQEALLTKDLFDGERYMVPCLRHMHRANAFSKHRLYTEAAREYEAALAIDPKRLDVLEATIKAEERTGNYARTKTLRACIPVRPLRHIND